jgi:hypothetical protein
MRYVLCVLLLAAGASTAFAQNAQTVPAPPPPTLLPQTSTSTSCLITCDTVAATCQNGCIVVGPAVTTSTPGAIPNTAGISSCNLACTTQALVCKQGCTR